MEKKGQNRKPFHKNSDDNRSFNPRSTIKEDEKPVLFQLGSIAYGVNDDVRLKPDPEITTTSRSSSLSLSSTSQTSSDNILEEEINAKESSSFNSSQHNKEISSLSSSLCDLRGSLETSTSQVSGLSPLEPTLLSPSVQMMEREEESDHQPERNSLPIMEKNFSLVSNDSLFSLSIGDNVIDRDDFFSYRDFKTGEVLVSGELLSFCPSVHVPLDSFDEGNSIDLEEEESVETEISWRNLEDCNISDEEAPSSTHSFSYPITKKKKKKKKGMKKKVTHQQQPQPQPQPQPQLQKQKKRCSWMCCNSTEPYLSCCKRLKCCSCCCSSCSWFFCCHWSCCCSSSKKILDDEIIRSSEEQKLQKANHKWFCCFPSCCSSSS